VNPSELLDEAEGRGIRLDWGAVADLLSGWRYGDLGVNKLAASFLATYFRGQKTRLLLDPAAGAGLLATALMDANAASEATLFVRGEEESRLASRMLSRHQTQVRVESALVGLNPKRIRADIVTSQPPWGMRPMQHQYHLPDGQTFTLRDSETSHIFFGSLVHLTDDGEAAFIMPEAFIWQSREGISALMPSLGVHVNSVISLPPGSSPQVSFGGVIVLASRRHTPDWFVARLESGRQIAVLVENLRSRQEGVAPPLGRLTDPRTFTTWHALTLRDEVAKEAQRLGLELIRFRDVTQAIKMGRRSSDGDFETMPNAIYLPTIGTSPVTTSPEDLTVKPQNVAQLVLDPGVADAQFVAAFLNSPMGRRIRSLMESGSVIPKITRTTLTADDAVLFLPSIDLQTEVKRVDAALELLGAQVASLRSGLWANPKSHRDVERKVARLGSGEDFEAWMESMPFPVASVLWRYHADSEARSKRDHLLHFFEALAQFVGTHLLSVLHNDQEWFAQEVEALVRPGTQGPIAFGRSTFGLWVMVGERLAKLFRRALSAGEVRDRCIQAFCVDDAEAIEALTRKSLFQVLGRVGRYRNEWIGHGGVESDPELHRRLSLLGVELDNIRSLFAAGYDPWRLVRPGPSRHRSGVFYYSASSMMGTRSDFRRVDVESLAPMDDGELYLYTPSLRRALRLLPFVRMMPSPRTEENACYFYSSLAGHEVRWVSYHFEADAEVVSADPDVVDTLLELGDAGTA
jgi:hypothetical protein